MSELTSASSSVAVCTCTHIARTHRTVWPDEEIAVDRTVIIEGALAECEVAGCDCLGYVESVSNLLWASDWSRRLPGHPTCTPASVAAMDAAIARAAGWLRDRL